MFSFLKIMGRFKFGLYLTLRDKHTALGKGCESYSYAHTCVKLTRGGIAMVGSDC